MTPDLQRDAPMLIRNARPDEFAAIGRIMVAVYSGLEGFPGPDKMPAYYRLLANIGELTQRPSVELLAAVDESGAVGGAVVYYGQMKYYGTPSTARHERNAAGFRLLAVDPAFRGRGLGRLLSEACIEKARAGGHDQLIIHSTRYMQVAWGMYERLGFERAAAYDFLQDEIPVAGFRLRLDK